MMGARSYCHIYLCKRTSPGDTTGIFYHMTHNTIDCGLQENLPKDAMNVYHANNAEIHVSYFVKLVRVRSGY